ncbi:Guanylate kinase [Trichinella spiralis]|uniref:Guanylate kinase n=1 Tax=Trichinella spiralis TaxID=6334 RepID=A0ABR3KWI9_TRISP
MQDAFSLNHEFLHKNSQGRELSNLSIVVSVVGPLKTQVFSGLTAAEWAFRETSVGLIVLSGPLPDGYAKVEPLLTACRSSLQGLC